LSVADVDAARVERAESELGAAPVAPEAIFAAEVDVFSPNAGGSVLSAETIPRLHCRAVVGAANDQLAEPADGDRLHARGILYGPDYLVNAGGLVSLLCEVGELDEDATIERVRDIGARLADLLRRSEAEHVPPHRMADRIVEEKLAAARAERRR
jgi:leucine dehydrogenase